MLRLTTTVHLLVLTLMARVQDQAAKLKDDRDRGSVSLEQVIITASLALLAIAIVAGIGVAARRYLAQI